MIFYPKIHALGNISSPLMTKFHSIRHVIFIVFQEADQWSKYHLIFNIHI